MSDLRISVYCQPARRSWSVKARQVISEPGRIDDVAGIGDNGRLPLNLVADLACEDNPKLGAFRMVMPAVGRLHRRQLLLVPVNDIGDCAVVVDEAILAALLRLLFE